MKEYKVGDTVKVDMQITQIESGLYKLERNGNAYWTSDDILKRQEQDKTYDDGLNDAWEVCRKIFWEMEVGGLPDDALQEIFGNNHDLDDVLMDYTAQDAIDKIKAWEDANAIRVGDVVEISGIKCLVTKKEGNCYFIIFPDGLCRKTYEGETVKKTGRTADISSYLFGVFGV